MGLDIRKMRAHRDPDETVIAAEMERALYPLSKPVGNLHQLRKNLQDIMWDDVGVMRTKTGLERGLGRIADIRAQLYEIGVDRGNLAYNLTWHDWMNLASLVDVSDVICRAALARENSRGAHFREDFPEPGNLDASYFTVARQVDNAIEVTQEDVQFTIVRPGETILPAGEPETLVGEHA